MNTAGTEAPLQTAGPLLTKTPVVAKDRVQRWLKTLAVPVIPPCPIGKAKIKNSLSSPKLNEAPFA
jgi:hypothetical protein